MSKIQIRCLASLSSSFRWVYLWNLVFLFLRRSVLLLHMGEPARLDLFIFCAKAEKTEKDLWLTSKETTLSPFVALSSTPPTSAIAHDAELGRTFDCFKVFFLLLREEMMNFGATKKMIFDNPHIFSIHSLSKKVFITLQATCLSPVTTCFAYISVEVTGLQLLSGVFFQLQFHRVNSVQPPFNSPWRFTVLRTSS